jgi:hypothetical protein
MQAAALQAPDAAQSRNPRLTQGTPLTEEEGGTIFFGLTFLHSETNPSLKKVIYFTFKVARVSQSGNGATSHPST